MIDERLYMIQGYVRRVRVRVRYQSGHGELEETWNGMRKLTRDAEFSEEVDAKSITFRDEEHRKTALGIQNPTFYPNPRLDPHRNRRYKDETKKFTSTSKTTGSDRTSCFALGKEHQTQMQEADNPRTETVRRNLNAVCRIVKDCGMQGRQ